MGEVELSQFDQLIFELNCRLVRGISIHAWPERIDLTKCKKRIAASLDVLELWPAKAAIAKEPFKRTQSKKWMIADEVDLSEFESIEAIYVGTSKRLNKANLNNRLALFAVSFAINGEIYLHHDPHILTLEAGLSGIAPWLEVVTPRYGFSALLESSRSICFHGGTPNPSDDENYLKRIRTYEQARYCGPDEDGFLGKRLLDVFEMNILSPQHLSSRVFGTSFGDWITRGGRGELRELKKDVHAWIVPDDIRPDIRQSLLKAKHLVMPV